MHSVLYALIELCARTRGRVWGLGGGGVHFTCASISIDQQTASDGILAREFMFLFYSWVG